MFEDIIKTIFNVGYTVWNSLIEIAMTLFTTSPTAASADVYTVTHNLYLAIADIALPIAILFFIFAICKDVMSAPADQQLRKFLSDALKFTIMVAVLANLWEVMGYVMQVADGVTDKLAASAGNASYQMTMSGDLEAAIIEVAQQKPDPNDLEGLGFMEKIIETIGQWTGIVFSWLLFFISAVISLCIIVASCVNILSSAFQRIIKPLAILPFASITVAMASGTHEAGRVTTNYVKTFFGFCISGAFMVICVKLGVALTNGGLIAFDFASMETTQKMLAICVQNMITPIVIAGLVKGTDSMISRIF